MIGLSFLLLGLVTLGSASPPIPRQPLIPHLRLASFPDNVTDVNGTLIPPYDTRYSFNQLIDHQNPKFGTFQQLYFHTWEYYRPGGPIILFTPGESDASDAFSFLTNSSILGAIARETGGATIVLEHRFFGSSNPMPDLSESSLKYLTIQQSIDDLVYFAQNVKLAMPGGNAVTPDKTPWILVGGSYSGALTAWTMANQPGVFWAGYASSAVVQPIVEFWQYFVPIQENMPQNCSADVQAVISHVDQVLASGDTTQISALKANFGLDTLQDDDFVSTLRTPLFSWQYLQPRTDASTRVFFTFCDALEGAADTPATGLGLDHALSAWGTFFIQRYLPYLCPNNTVTFESFFSFHSHRSDSLFSECFNTHDPNESFWTDTTVKNADRSWQWMVCNEVGWFQVGAPPGTSTPNLISTTLRAASEERQCSFYFPQTLSATSAPKVDATSFAYHGYDISVDRLFVANGKSDPWREATLSASTQNIASTALRPIVMADGFHCSDLQIDSGTIDPSIAALQTQALSTMKTWLADFKPGTAPSTGASSWKRKRKYWLRER
ncbi:serine carboxypeptidase S28-domain-containing protein [Mycena floridula]|nr:serine carboxypeptidase S28-domain-containing protein [Mycena floridula]